MNKHNAKIKYWASISKEERSARMRKVALAKHAKKTKAERSLHAKIMAKARWAKKLSTT